VRDGGQKWSSKMAFRFALPRRGRDLASFSIAKQTNVTNATIFPRLPSIINSALSAICRTERTEAGERGLGSLGQAQPHPSAGRR
jgi:hypothetical protein